MNSAYRGESSQAGWTTEAHLLGGQRTDPDAIAGMIALPSARSTHEPVVRSEEGSEAASPIMQTILIYRESGEIRACVYLKQKGSSAYLGMLTVSPVLQGSGVGRKVLAAAESWVKSNWNSKRIEMTVIESRHELIAWYERRGYARTLVREPFPSHDPRFGIPLVENLMFNVLEKILGGN